MTRIKICGITSLEDARLAVDLGADALGFVFAESPRQVTPDAVRQFIRQLPPLIATIGVFVDESIENVERIFHFCALSAVQLHGDEDTEYHRQLSIPWVQAIRVRDDRQLKMIKSAGLPCMLLDTYDPQARGGTGKTFDWDIARRATEYTNVILSGGLYRRNIKQALTVVQPYAVDVSSGVEERPGRKDCKKLQQFINEVRTWDSQANSVTSASTAADSFLKH